jgi:hypothetical protein
MFTHDSSYGCVGFDSPNAEYKVEDEHSVSSHVTSAALLTHTIRYPTSRDLMLEKLFSHFSTRSHFQMSRK